MQDKKYCRCCGILISDINSADYFRHISIKYCPTCKDTIKHYQGAERQYNFRQRKKKLDKLRDERLQLLAEENELLRQRILQLREEKND